MPLISQILEGAGQATYGDRGVLEGFTITPIKSSLYDKNFSEVIRFDTIPEPFKYTKNANYSSLKIPGRSEPIRAYEDSSPTVARFTGRFIALGKGVKSNSAVTAFGTGGQLLGRFVTATAPFLGIGGNIASLIANSDRKIQATVNTVVDEVHLQVNRLEALCYPQHSENGHIYSPPRVELQFGENFRRQGIITSVGVTFGGPFEYNTLLAYMADCDVTFEEVNTKSRGYGDVYSRSYTRESDTPQNIGDRLRKDTISMAGSIFGL